MEEQGWWLFCGGGDWRICHVKTLTCGSCGSTRDGGDDGGRDEAWKRSAGVFPVVQYLPSGGWVLGPVSLASHTSYPGLEFVRIHCQEMNILYQFSRTKVVPCLDQC